MRLSARMAVPNADRDNYHTTNDRRSLACAPCQVVHMTGDLTGDASLDRTIAIVWS